MTEQPLYFDGKSLSTWPTEWVRLVCRDCDRRGQYRKARLLARYGGDVDLTFLRLHLTKPCRLGRLCRARFVDLPGPLMGRPVPNGPMTVGALIEILRTYSPRLPVLIAGPAFGLAKRVTTVAVDARGRASRDGEPFVLIAADGPPPAGGVAQEPPTSATG